MSGDYHTCTIGARFLRWFVNHVNGRLAAADMERLPETSFAAENVDVWRERDYVDVTVRFKTEKCLIAVENKPESASSHHRHQVMGYERTLRGKHKGHTVKSVLLTTSPEEDVDFQGIAHVGWGSVHDAIRSLLTAGKFPSPSVQAFIRQYLDLLDRWFHPTGGEGFMALLSDHRSILTKLRRILKEDGEDGVSAMVPEDRADYRGALVRLVRQSRHDPKELRAAVATFLKGRGRTPQYSNNPSRSHYWLWWTDAGLGDAAQSMGGQRSSVCWMMQFTRRDSVQIDFDLYSNPDSSEQCAFVDRLMSFMDETPINRQKPEEYSVNDEGYGWQRVYRRELLSNEELLEMSAPEVKDEVIRRLEDFMDADDSEYRRIDDYFRCLAFRFDELASPREDSPQ